MDTGNRIVNRPLINPRWLASACMLLAAALQQGCTALTVAQTNQLIGATGATALGMTPGSDLDQIYYLGSFDPQGQLPPAVYRVRVRGQASILNSMRFASSWVPAEVVDALNGSVGFGAKGEGVEISPSQGNPGPLSDAGRGLWLFGPEGFREAPRGHRLVILMGSSPEKVEQAFSSALGTLAMAKSDIGRSVQDSRLFELLLRLSDERRRLAALALPPLAAAGAAP